jgi:23S rRNA (cytosine1962-C5)-methyltransferase
MGAVILRPGREKPVLNHHPWVFSGAIGRIDGEPAPGDMVDVLDRQGRFLARGYFNRHSQITVRLVTWVEGEVPDRSFWRRRIEGAIERRRALLQEDQTTACRLVHGESDLLPGLIVDRYGDYLVVQALTLGIECRKKEIVDILVELAGPRGVYERSDVDVRAKERLEHSTGLLWGEIPPDLVEIREHGHAFRVDVKRGQKTGFFLDQRDNRRRLQRYCEGRSVLNAFAYTGSFGVYAARSGAKHITNIDTSEPALSLARENMEGNGLGAHPTEYTVGDVFAELRRFRDAGRQFELVVLDPPKFAHSRSQVQAACRGYKDINLLALKLLSSGGILFTMSCSGSVSADLFQKVVFGASIDAGKDVQVLERLSQAADHPTLLSFPEGDYLKGMACRIL